MQKFNIPYIAPIFEQTVRMIFSKKHKWIRVVFEDVQTGQVLGWSRMKYKKLPISFATETTVKVNGDDYQVVKAEPEVEKEYRKSGEILVRVIPAGEAGTAQVQFEQEEIPEVPRSEYYTPGTDEPAKVEKVATEGEEEVYSLPSVESHDPACAPATENEKALYLPRDYWREVELVPQGVLDSIREVFGAVGDIWKDAKIKGVEPPAFRRMYRRGAFTEPLLKANLDYRSLINNYFAFHVPYAGLIFPDEGAEVQEAFAFRTTSGLDFYGIKRESQVCVLGLALTNTAPEEKMLRQDCKYLAKLITDHQLYLVDWTESLLLAGEEELYAYLRRTDYLGQDR